jgi:hypothetical protein
VNHEHSIGAGRSLIAYHPTLRAKLAPAGLPYVPAWPPSHPNEPPRHSDRFRGRHCI